MRRSIVEHGPDTSDLEPGLAPCSASAGPASTTCRLEGVHDEAIASPRAVGAAEAWDWRACRSFLPRHGKGHASPPTSITAPTSTLRQGSPTSWRCRPAVPSQEELPPGAFVLVDQFVDRTHKRESCSSARLRRPCLDGWPGVAARAHLPQPPAEGIDAIDGGTYVCMEGPYPPAAESLTYKAAGSVIGMTNMPEAKLAREAEICHASVAMVTDYDCWHPHHEAVTVQDIIRVLNSNADRAKALVARLARDFPREHEPCPIGSDRALDTALITAPEARDPALLKKLDAVAGRVLRS